LLDPAFGLVTKLSIAQFAAAGGRRRQMSIALPDFAIEDFRVAESLRWWDAETRCTLVVSQPRVDPDLWWQYGRGAVRSYRRHGVEGALDRDALRNGADTVLFFVVLDERGKMIAGVRAKGPLRSADDSHAVIEWEGQRGHSAVRKMITDRLPHGVLEMKSAWVCDDTDMGRSLTDAVARSGFHMMALLDIQFCMATAADYVINCWCSSGGVVAPIPATPYPDQRYQTRMMWWDRRTFTRYAQPNQVAKIITETINLGRMRVPAFA
jgi:hypothetical protein